MRFPFILLVAAALSGGLDAGWCQVARPPRILDSLPNTPAGHAARALLNDYNEGSLGSPRWLRWRQIIGAAEVRKVEESSPHELRVWIQGTTSLGWLGWGIKVDDEETISREQVPVFWMGGRPAPEFRTSTARPASATEVARRLAEYFTGMEAADLFSGSVIVAQHGRTVFEGAFGLADKAAGRRNRLDTRFPLASVGKVFTAAAVANLVSRGKLSFSDSIATLLPDYPIAGTGSATVGQLLSHTAGLGSSPTDWIARREPITLEDLVKLTAVTPAFPPGSDVRYCNECFLVAGLIIERVSGMPYESFVRRFIFEPAEMKDTGWDLITDHDQRRAITYSNLRVDPAVGQVFASGPRRDASGLQGLKGTAAGGAYSTAADLLAFLNSLRSYRLADSNTTELLFQPHADMSFGRANGYGFELMTKPVKVIGKGGNAQGTSAQIEWYPDSGYSIIILSNYDMSAQVAAEGIRELVLGFGPGR